MIWPPLGKAVPSMNLKLGIKTLTGKCYFSYFIEAFKAGLYEAKRWFMERHMH